MDKSIDFDQVADLYDIYVRSDADVGFWIEEAPPPPCDVLELMCGSGRIGQHLIEAGYRYTGVDYSEGLLDRFRAKLAGKEHTAELIHADARFLALPRTFDFIFIGFHALSEVLGTEARLRLMKNARDQLNPAGRFTFSLQNPAVRKLSLDGRTSAPIVAQFDDRDRALEFSWQLLPPSPTGRVTGMQFYRIKDAAGRLVEERELEVRFDLVDKAEAEDLVARAGLRVERLWGNYDRTVFLQTSPFMIYRCTPA